MPETDSLMLKFRNTGGIFTNLIVITKKKHEMPFKAEKKVKIFVYGTLRKGGLAAHFLEKFPLVYPNTTLKGFSLYDGGWYPFAVPASESCVITGDVFEIPEIILPQLDEYEGPEYKRISPENQELFIYVVKADARVKGLLKVEEGDWLKYWEKKNNASGAGSAGAE